MHIAWGLLLIICVIVIVVLMWVNSHRRAPLCTAVALLTEKSEAFDMLVYMASNFLDPLSFCHLRLVCRSAARIVMPGRVFLRVCYDVLDP